MLRILVTGAFGNVGSHTVPELRRRGREVRAVAVMDTVIHLAAMIPPGADDHPELARVTNVDGTATIIAAGRAQPTPPRLLFTSTFDVPGTRWTSRPRATGTTRWSRPTRTSPGPFTHHNGSAQVVVDTDGGTRFAWIADFLPHDQAERTDAMRQRGITTIGETLV